MKASFNALAQTAVSGRDWIVVGDGTSVARHFAHLLTELGAARVLIVAAFDDGGPTPVESPHPTIVLGVKSSPGLDLIRASLNAFRNLPEQACTKIDEWDPQKNAMVFTPLWSDDQPLHGRKVFGARWPQWQQLENKLTCDAIWDSIGIPRSPARVLPVYEAALQAAHAELDEGDGTVWAGDNKEGWHGGAEYLRWIRDTKDFRGAFPFFRSHCDQVRIQPFMVGIPCSIHGMVFPETVITFRPCEMLVFRQKGSTRLKYGGAATTWDPPPKDRHTMRETAKATGIYLRQHYGYRGVFTIDGIMTAEGFRPTEINPRYGAAIDRLMGNLPHIPLYVLNKILCEGVPLAYDPSMLEKTIIEAADAKRVIRAGFAIPSIDSSKPKKAYFKWSGQSWIENSQSRDAIVQLYPLSQGGYLAIRINPDVIPAGQSPAEQIAVLAKQTESWGHGLNNLTPAPNVRF